MSSGFLPTMITFIMAMMITLSLIQTTHAYKICFISLPWPGECKSQHVFAYTLAARGHNVSFAMPDEYKGILPQHPNITFIGTGPTSVTIRELRDLMTQLARASFHRAKRLIIPTYWKLTNNFLHLFPYLNNSENKPDLIIFSLAAVAAADIAEALGIPSVLFQPSSLFEPFATYLYGHRIEPAYIPALGTFLKQEMTFMERVKNTVLALGIRAHAEFDAVAGRNSVREALGLPPLSAGFVPPPTLVICAQSWGLVPAHPVSPYIHLVGPMLPPLHLTPIDETLIQWLDSSEEKVIVVALERVFRLDPTVVLHVVNALGKMPRRVLWLIYKDETEQQQGITVASNTHIHIYEGHDLFSLLEHPKVDIFFTAGSVNSFSEGLWHGLPEVCMGAHFDQQESCVALEHSGAGLALNKETVTEEKIIDSLLRVLNEPQFREKAKLVSRIFRTEGRAELAATLIENALYIGKTDRLVPFGSRLPWYQSNLLDVLLFVAVVKCSVVILLGFFVWKYCCGLLCSQLIGQT